MAAEPTQYERVNVIIPRSLKRELVKLAKDTDSSLTRIMKIAIKDYLTSQKKSGGDNVRSK